MSSILTNNSAMVALDTLRGINKNLTDVQSQISTGKKIASSTDNAAIWSIATVMESDVSSFSQVSDSLNLGSATVGVAQAASEQVTDLLQKAKSTIVSASDASISDSDREKYQVDLAELTATIGSIVDAASLNGTNLLKEGDDVSILSSLNRGSDGSVSTGTIGVARQDLTTTAAADAIDAVDAVTGGAIADTDAFGAAFSSATLTDADGLQTSNLTITAGAGETTASATTYTLDLGNGDVEFEVAAGLNEDEIAAQLETDIETYLGDLDPGAGGAEGNVATNLSVDVTDNVLTFTNAGDAGDNSENIAVAVTSVENATVEAVEAEDAVEAGGLAALATLDISTSEGAATALGEIDDLLQTAIDATAFFGSKQQRISNQNEFITGLSDSLKTGIGALTDANLEEASARLQSLQVQQQLGVQALSIANQAPQSLLSLFR
jgi:flagellin